MSSARGPQLRSRRLTGSYRRFRQLIHESAKFLIVGGIGAIIVLAGSDALHYDLGLGEYTSVTIANIVATLFTFLGNRYWSFRDRQGAGARSEGVMFFVLNGVGLLIQYGCIALIDDALGMSGRLWYLVALVIGTGLGTLFRFWSYRKWIWVPPEVHIARLRRGRHRLGRDLSTVPPPPQPQYPQPQYPQQSPAAARVPVPQPALARSGSTARPDVRPGSRQP